MRDLPVPRAHDHGSVYSRHHRDVQRPQQLVGEPVLGGHAPMDQPLLAWRYGFELWPSFHDSPRRFPCRRVPNHTIKLRAMDDCDEILIASNTTGRVAQVRGQELRRRYRRGLRTEEDQARVRSLVTILVFLWINAAKATKDVPKNQNQINKPVKKIPRPLLLKLLKQQKS